jgi:hypothetical protein
MAPAILMRQLRESVSREEHTASRQAGRENGEFSLGDLGVLSD